MFDCRKLLSYVQLIGTIILIITFIFFFLVLWHADSILNSDYWQVLCICLYACVCVCLSVYIIRDVYLCSFFINNLQAISVCTKRTRGRGRERRKKREFFFFFLSFPEIMRLVSNIFAMITDRYYHLFSTLSFWSSVVQGQNWQIICSDLLMNRL